jgi:uncharacterized protein YdaU (DUF1376 family)
VGAVTGKPPDTWMPLYIGDYLRKTMHLTIDQHGAYLMLIMACWCDGGALADDDEHLAAICRVPIARWLKLRPTLMRFFTIDDTGWHNKRVSKELTKAAGITEHRRNAGRASGRARGQQTGSKTSTNEQQTGNKCSTSVQQVYEQTGRPSPSQSEGEEGDEVSLRNPTTQNYKNLTSLTETNSARAGGDNLLTETIGEPFDDGESEGKCSFKKLVDDPVARAARSAPNGASKGTKRIRRDLLISKVTRFAKDTFPEPEALIAIAGLCGGDTEHDEQWWLDHLDKLMKAERWDDTADRQDSAA